MIILLRQRASVREINQAKKDFADYIKIVVDVKRKILAAGGKLHTDGEKILLDSGSKQENLWGGGLDLATGNIDTQAVINIRPLDKNDSMEILDPEKRKRFLTIAQKILK